MKKITLLVLAIFSITLFSFQDGPKKGMDKETRKKAQKELAAYNKENVIPVILENRKEFETKLSSDEKKELVSLRVKMKALGEQKKASKKGKTKGEAPTEEQKEARAALQKEMRQIMTSAWAIVDNHEADLKAIKESNKANEEKWKEDIKAIMMKYKPENAEKGKGKKHGHKMKQNPMGPNKDVMFVMMDPSQSIDEIAENMEKMAKKRHGQHGKKGKSKGHASPDQEND
ncbi:hypothetical protein [Flammeovirga pacifica]|uniref:Uncharacterized protein n=1 Tax=Flammeovirga pacifica TaxID=915059 RepID=A0A1S1Z4G0_FLAPC|nr:hypothetical protein [Flammeovirga pacifica]OHX68174.1 hypothetical protein NH26_18385 [Flammeovirga pacifica]